MDEIKEEVYGKLNVSTLKTMLKERGARFSGRKEELVERLVCFVFFKKSLITTNFVVSYHRIKSGKIIFTGK